MTQILSQLEAQWEDHFGSLHRGTVSPGGTIWEGDAADAAQQRSFADLVKVRGAADTLHGAATAARRGADELQWAKRRALDAVAEAEGAGFTVGEDLSVTSRAGGGNLFEQARRQAEAKQHAALIEARAAELSALDKQTAAKITTASAALSELGFAESPPANAPAPANPVTWIGPLPEDNPVPSFINFSDIPQMTLKCIDIRMFDIPGMNFRCFIYHDDGTLEVFLSP